MATLLEQNVINLFDQLSSEEQDNLLEVLKNHRIEKRRKEIAQNAKDTLKAVENGTAFCGNAEELKEYLLDKSN